MSAIPWVLGPRHFRLYQCFQVHPTRNRAVVIAEGGELGVARLSEGGKMGGARLSGVGGNGWGKTIPDLLAVLLIQ